MIERLLYISESRIEPSEADAVISRIISDAQRKNARLNLTGALLFTGIYFAQILEGPTTSISQLMTSLTADTRHSDIVITYRSPIIVRKFSNLKLAYHGPSQFVSRHIVRLMNNPSRYEQKRATEWLTALALEFSSSRST